MSICVAIQDCIRRESFHRIMAARACRASGSRAPSPSSRSAPIWSRPFGLRSLAEDPRWSRGSRGRATGGRTRFRGFAAPAGAPRGARSSRAAGRSPARSPAKCAGSCSLHLSARLPPWSFGFISLLRSGSVAESLALGCAASPVLRCPHHSLRACSDRVTPRRIRPRPRRAGLNISAAVAWARPRRSGSTPVLVLCMFSSKYMGARLCMWSLPKN